MTRRRRKIKADSFIHVGRELPPFPNVRQSAPLQVRKYSVMIDVSAAF